MRQVKVTGIAARYAVLLRALAWGTLAALPLHAHGQVAEYELKAAFLFNFALFTQPTDTASTPVGSSSEPYRICILGKDPFGAATKSLTKRMIAGRPIAVKVTNATDELKQCQLIFIPEAERESARRAANAVSGLPIITVGEFKDFPAGGALFNLIVVDDKVAFQVNTQVARSHQLDVSAKLTRLAASVR